MIGNGNITYGSLGAPSGSINVAGANDGLSVSATRFIQLGQLAGTGGAGPAALIDNREIPFGAFSLTFFDPVTTDNIVFTPGQNNEMTINTAQNLNALILMQNFHAGTGSGVSFQAENDLSSSALLGITSSVYTSFNFPPDSMRLDSSSSSGIFIDAWGALVGHPNPTIAFATGGIGTPHTKMVLNNAGNLILGNLGVVNPPDNGNNLQVGASATIATKLGVGGPTTMTAKVHIGAGTATAGTGPLKLTSGTLLTTPEAGTFEFDGTHLYFTIGAVRSTII